ncbi:MAG TPA: PIG-L family deacetylase [Steroidobacteraceae bacterium]|nr:PIG-L family deacetylase [Steroidobacteraceae bacterium]
MSSMSASSAAALLAAAALAARAAGCAAAPATASLPRLDAQTSLLVVAPHPDDETLCCAGIIQRVVRAGGRASVVWITSGDASELDLLLIEKSLFVKPDKARDLAVRRMREARTATARLGVPAAGQLFLGYPDRGVLRLLTDHHATPYTSTFTGAAAVPYPAALFPGHPYTGESLERDFEAVLERVQPTLILAPSPRDSHADHRAAGLLTIAVSTRRGVLPGVHYWIVHGGEGWPTPRGLLPGVPLTAAPRSRGLALAVFALEPAEEDRMLEALRAYDTQMRTLAPFLLAFVRSTELFASQPGAELAPP